MENRLKERLTGAAILVALVVMLVPEMFHGQRGDVAASASSSGEGPPLRSYTIDLSNNPIRTAPLQSTPVNAGNDDKPTNASPPDQSAMTSSSATAASAPAIVTSVPMPAPATAPPTIKPVPTPAVASPTIKPVPAPATASPTIKPLPTPAPATVASGAKPMPATVASTAKPAPVPAPAAAPPTPKPAPTPAPAAAPPMGKQPSVAASARAPATTSHAPSNGGWAVQLGLFAKRDNAERLVRAAQAKGFGVTVSNADAKGLYRVYAAGMADRSAAEAYAQRVKDQGLPAAVIASP